MPSTTTTNDNETSKTNFDKFEELKREDFLSDQNRNDIEEFLKDLIAVDDSKIDKERVKKYISQWRQILPHTDFHLKQGGYENWRDLKLKVKNDIEKKGEAEATLRDRVMAMRKFLQYQYPDIPSRPQWVFRLLESDVMNTTHPDKEDRERQYEFIWPDEILAMCKKAENKRDRLRPSWGDFPASFHRRALGRGVPIPDRCRG